MLGNRMVEGFLNLVGVAGSKLEGKLGRFAAKS